MPESAEAPTAPYHEPLCCCNTSPRGTARFQLARSWHEAAARLGDPWVVRFALTVGDPRIRDLVVALDEDDVPMAETWRQVGEAAWKLGLRRPSYHLVRVLCRRHRALAAARAAVRRAAAELVLAIGSPYVVRIPQALERLEQARARERLVLQQHKGSPTDDP